ncbi:MAG: cytochrome c [Roseovarius sp.]|nr:cytochrome c [Roseovarius sp.]
MRIGIYASVLTVIGLCGPAMAQDVRQGEKTFQRYCAACHGADASGHGPMRPVLSVVPSDLTQLSNMNGGAFPLARTVHQIDGRAPMAAHGGPMPIYGDFFQGRDVVLSLGNGEQMRSSRQVVDLLAYLQAVQRR